MDIQVGDVVYAEQARAEIEGSAFRGVVVCLHSEQDREYVIVKSAGAQMLCFKETAVRIPLPLINEDEAWLVEERAPRSRTLEELITYRESKIS